MCVETNFQLLMLSSNLLKSKIPMSGGGGWWWNQLSTFDAESNFALKKKKKKKKKIAKNFLSFRAKMGTDLFWTSSTNRVATFESVQNSLTFP